MLPLHQEAIAGLSGYDPKSEVLETTVLSVYTTDLEKANKNTASPVRKAVPDYRYLDPVGATHLHGSLLLRV